MSTVLKSEKIENQQKKQDSPESHQNNPYYFSVSMEGYYKRLPYSWISFDRISGVIFSFKNYLF